MALVDTSPVNAETGGAAVIDLGAKRAERDTKRAAALVALHLCLTGIIDIERELGEALKAHTLSPDDDAARQRVDDLIMRRTILRDLARGQVREAQALGRVPPIAGLTG